MSRLKIYAEDNPNDDQEFTEFAAISSQLAAQGILFTRWEANQPLQNDSSQADIIAAYQAEVDKLMQEQGFQSVDVVSLSPEHPDKDTLRAKFLDEHTHSEDEVRFFVDGSGLFYVHADHKVYAVLCEKGDLLSVPANTSHWFDMGSQPFFKCIRLFTNPAGWVAHFTQNDIAKRFPTMDEFQ